MIRKITTFTLLGAFLCGAALGLATLPVSQVWANEDSEDQPGELKIPEEGGYHENPPRIDPGLNADPDMWDVDRWNGRRHETEPGPDASEILRLPGHFGKVIGLVWLAVEQFELQRFLNNR